MKVAKSQKMFLGPSSMKFFKAIKHWKIWDCLEASSRIGFQKRYWIGVANDCPCSAEQLSLSQRLSHAWALDWDRIQFNLIQVGSILWSIVSFIQAGGGSSDLESNDKIMRRSRF